ncbi:MAG: TM1802 family CRISPR-associated protein [Desulfonauticus sp.]|nr:TM1802 family CRISPR-associated protein [Desulfonauticus sp.]
MLHILYDLGQRIPRAIPYQPIRENSYLIIFDVQNNSLKTEELDVQKAKRYVWVGNRKGQASKDRLIVEGDALRYLIFTTPFLFLNSLKDLKNISLQNLITRLNSITHKIGILELKNNKDKSFLMLKVYKLLEPTQQEVFLEKLKNALEYNKENATIEDVLNNSAPTLKQQDFEKLVSSTLQEIINTGIPAKSQILFTFKDEHGILPEDPEYRKYVEYTFKPKFDQGRVGICRLCNKKDKLTPKTSAFKFFKFWNTDKPGFAPLLQSENFSSAFGLCANCYEVILSGDHFAWENLKSQLAQVGVILLPYPVPEKTDLKELGELLKKRLNAINTIEAWQEFKNLLKEQREINNLWEEIKESTYIDFVFFASSQSSVKVLKVIQDVPPSRLDEIDNARIESAKWAEQYFDEVNKKPYIWNLDLKTQFSLIPTRKDTKVPSLFLNYLESLLLGDIFPRESLIKGFLEIARAHYLGYVGGFKGVPSGHTLEQFMVQTLIFQHYAKKLGVIAFLPTGGQKMTLENLPDHLKTYIQNQVPVNKAQALFLLGYVIGLIAHSQQKGIKLNETKSPAILNVISFTGMDDVKIRRMVNQVADRMRHYLKGWDYNEAEKVLATALYLLEADKSSLPAYENTYWVLAGYGFSRLGLKDKKDNQ